MNYSKLTNDEFYKILCEIMDENRNSLLDVPGAYEIFSEYFNNDVLERWEQRQENEE